MRLAVARPRRRSARSSSSVSGRRPSWSAPTPTGRSRSRAGCSTAPASRCPTGWSRSGMPMRGGRYAGSAGWGRCQTASDGGYGFTTLKPGAVHEPDGTVQAPHVTVLCFARGLLKPVLTRLYFPDEGEANAADPCSGLSRTRRRGRRSSRRRRGLGAMASTSACRATARRSSSRRPRPVSERGGMSDDAYERGMQVRREVLGDAHVDAAIAAHDRFHRRLPGADHALRVGRHLGAAGPRSPHAQRGHADGARGGRAGAASSRCTCAAARRNGLSGTRSRRCCCRPPSTAACRRRTGHSRVAQQVYQEEGAA